MKVMCRSNRRFIEESVRKGAFPEPSFCPFKLEKEDVRTYVKWFYINGINSIQVEKAQKGLFAWLQQVGGYCGGKRGRRKELRLATRPGPAAIGWLS